MDRQESSTGDPSSAIARESTGHETKASDATLSPANIQRVAEKLTASGVSSETIQELFVAMGTGQLTNPLQHKMTEGHISAVIELASKHDEREFELAKGQQSIAASNRIYLLGVLLLVAIVLVFLVVVFRNDKDVLIPLVTGLFGLATGFAGGFGMGRRKD